MESQGNKQLPRYTFIREGWTTAPEPTVDQVVAWAKENKGMEIEPVSVGMQVRALGYRTERVFRDGKLWRLIRKNP